MVRTRWQAFVVAALALAGALIVIPAVAQEPDPFSGDRFAPVPASDVSFGVGIRSIAIVPSEPATEAAAAVATVRFTAPILNPAIDLRVSVLVGEPDGSATRASLLLGADGSSSGAVETGGTGGWELVTSTDAALSADGAAAEITLPASAVDAGGSVWAESELQSAEAVAVTATPLYAADALVGAPDGALPGNGWARARGSAGVIPMPVQTGTPSPSLATANRALMVITDERPATELLGSPVIAVSDFVRIAPDEIAATGATDFVRIDRMTGSVQLLEASDGGMTDVSGDSSWLGQGPSATDPGAPGTVSLDVPALAAVVGVPDDPTSLAVSVDRSSTLFDGTVVTNYGVSATVAWLDLAAEEAAGVPEALATTTVPSGASASSDEATSSVPGPVLIGVALAVLLVAAVVVLVVRRRGRATAPAGPAVAVTPEVVAPPVAPSQPTQPTSPTRGVAPAQALAALDEELAELARLSEPPPDRSG